jgi:carbonyl reductase 1
MGQGMEEVINTNYFGPRRVNDTFGKLLKSHGGRIVNIASASGPFFVTNMSDKDPLTEKMTKPWTITGGITELDSIAQNINMNGDSYGASKALVNAYTGLHAKTDRNLIINSCSPGWIATDMTQGMGASNPPSKGAVVPCWLMMDEEVAKLPTGRYYGSDCVRSPLHFYRGPGEDPYVNDEDLV